MKFATIDKKNRSTSLTLSYNAVEELGRRVLMHGASIS